MAMFKSSFPISGDLGIYVKQRSTGQPPKQTNTHWNQDEDLTQKEDQTIGHSTGPHAGDEARHSKTWRDIDTNTNTELGRYRDRYLDRRGRSLLVRQASRSASPKAIRTKDRVRG